MAEANELLAKGRKAELARIKETYERPHCALVWEASRILLEGGHLPAIQAGADYLVTVLDSDAKAALLRALLDDKETEK